MEEGIIAINCEELQAAAKAYESAKIDCDAAIKSLTDSLNSALSVWDDSSKENWTGLIMSAQTNLQNVSSRITQNAKVLEDIARAAAETEVNVKTGITSMGMQS